MELSRWSQQIHQLFEMFRKLGKPIFCGVRFLARHIGASQRTVKRALAELRKAGIIQSTRRYRRTSTQEMLDDRQMALPFEATPEPRKSSCPRIGPTVVTPEKIYKTKTGLQPELCEKCAGSGFVFIERGGYSGARECSCRAVLFGSRAA